MIDQKTATPPPPGLATVSADKRSRGLGAAIALAFAEVDADVVIARPERSPSSTPSPSKSAAPAVAHVVVGDLAHPESTAQLAGAAVALLPARGHAPNPLERRGFVVSGDAFGDEELFARCGRRCVVS